MPIGVSRLRLFARPHRRAPRGLACGLLVVMSMGMAVVMVVIAMLVMVVIVMVMT